MDASAAERYVEELKGAWNKLDDTDKLVIGGAGALTLAGALIAVITRSAVPFLSGAAGGALVVTARIVTKESVKEDKVKPVQAKTTPAQTRKAKVEDNTLGAPMVPMTYGAPVQTFNGLVTEDEAVKFPLMHRIPEADIRTDPLNEAIAPVATAPHTAGAVTDFW